MVDPESTVEPESSDERSARPTPGLVGVFVVSKPALELIALDRDGRAVLGRHDGGDAPPDKQASRRHAELTCARGRFTISDLGSHNGTFVDGAAIDGPTAIAPPAVIRIGHSVFVLTSDVRPLAGAPVIVDERGVIGPRLGAVLDRIARTSAESLLVRGDSGTGKELAARTFHGGRGPFVAVNCAAIPEGLAERLLFGTLKGAYSGAGADAEGYIAAADGGTLFLDEIGELEAGVQAKLLRVLETRELLPLGASRPHAVSTRFCFATLRNLRAAMQEGTFRPDLFYRLSRDELALPPLRDRPEEIPWLIELELRRVDPALAAHALLVETCLLRPWPGNVRELLTAVRSAAAAAREAGDPIVRARHLDPAAGRTGAPAPAAVREPTREEVERAIAEQHGNLTAVARALGLHRLQLYRLLARLGITR